MDDPKKVPEVTLRRFADGTHGVFAGERFLGTIRHEDLRTYIATYLPGYLPPRGDGIAALGAKLPEIDREVRERAQALMSRESLTYNKALKKVLASDKDLRERWNAAHRRNLDGTGEVKR